MYNSDGITVSQAAPFVQGHLKPPLPSTRSPQLASSSMTYASQEYGTIERNSNKKPPGKTKRTFVVSGIRVTQPAHPFHAWSYSRRRWERCSKVLRWPSASEVKVKHERKYLTRCKLQLESFEMAFGFGSESETRKKRSDKI